MTNAIDALMTDNTANAVAERMGYANWRWSRSGVSESTYLYMWNDTAEQVKVRFSNHDDKHFDADESLFTLKLTDCVSLEAEEDEYGDALWSDTADWRGDYWVESVQNLMYTLNQRLASWGGRK